MYISECYGRLWVSMGFWVSVGDYECLYGYLWVFMGMYGCLWVAVDVCGCNECLWVSMGVWGFMGILSVNGYL